MNIRTMSVRNKEESARDEERNEIDQKGKKIFNTKILTGLKQKLEYESVNFKSAFKVKKVQSQKKLIRTPQIAFDYFEVYGDVVRLIALTFGVSVVQDEISRIRRAKIDSGNNGFLVKQTLKKRLWWNVVS